MLPRLVAVAALALLLLGTSSGADVAGAANGLPADSALHVLMEPETHRPTRFLDDASASSDASLPPTIQDGIGPGSGLHQRATPDASGGFLCTAAFLLRDPATATYYLSTAGHCLVRDEADPAPYTGAADPDKVDHEVDICVAECIDNALGQGTYVKLVAGDGYAPVTYAESGGPGQDFGIVEIPAEHHGLLRPAMPQFGGPTGYDPSAFGDTLVHYGHGTYCCPSPVGGVASRTPADQGRTAVSLGPSSIFGAPAGTSFSAMGSSTGGDSGSGVAIGTPDAANALRGGAAVGVLTHGTVVEGLPYFEGTTLAHGLDMVRAATGLQLQLVLDGDPLTAIPVPPTPGRIAIHSPLAGATVRPGGDGTVAIEGSAGLGNQTPPADALVQVAIDDAAFGLDSRIAVAGNATWSAQWDLHGVPLGAHRIYARLVAADGTELAAVNQTVTVAARVPGSAPTGSGGAPGQGGASSGPGGVSGSNSSTRKSPGLDMALPIAGLLALAALLRRR
jgi:hypothetical protein